MKKELYILPFDHRNSFIKGILGIVNGEPSEDDLEKARELKRIIYDAFVESVNSGVSKEYAGILVDEWLGSSVLDDAQKEGFIVCVPVEKSGQKEFDFENGDNFREGIEKRNPTYVKALLRYNPDDDKEMNSRQAAKLAALGDFLKEKENKFLLEMLVPPTAEQKVKDYDNKIRPKLEVKAVKELHAAGVNPDVWKIEGMDKSSDMQKVADEIVKENKDAKIIILGRGESKEHAEKWLKAGKKVDIAIGFAIGRTIFKEALEEFTKENISREEAVLRIKENYMHFVDVWQN